MKLSDHCADCGKPLPLDRPLFCAANNRGARCEKCELRAAAVQEVERLRELQQEARHGSP